MANLSDYFANNRYQSKYEFGTRIFAKWNKIPFVGTIYGDGVISEIEGPRLTISLDLPIKFENKVYYSIIASHKDVKEIKRLNNIVLETVHTQTKKETHNVNNTKKPRKRISG